MASCDDEGVGLEERFGICCLVGEEQVDVRIKVVGCIRR